MRSILRKPPGGIFPYKIKLLSGYPHPVPSFLFQRNGAFSLKIFSVPLRDIKNPPMSLLGSNCRSNHQGIIAYASDTTTGATGLYLPTAADISTAIDIIARHTQMQEWIEGSSWADAAACPDGRRPSTGDVVTKSGDKVTIENDSVTVFVTAKI